MEASALMQVASHNIPVLNVRGVELATMWVEIALIPSRKHSASQTHSKQCVLSLKNSYKSPRFYCKHKHKKGAGLLASLLFVCSFYY